VSGAGNGDLESVSFDQDRLFDLTGRVAIVTGAGQGLGQTFALGLARQGASVAVLDIDEEKAGKAAAAIAALTQRQVRGYQVDVADKTQVDDAFARVEDDLGPLAILVNNAGLWSRVPALELSLEEWNRVLAVNLTGTFLCSQAGARAMLRRGKGSIVNISSISGTLGMKGRTAYTATKHGILGLTKTFAHDLAADGIRVNAIGPGAHETAMTAAWRADPDVLQNEFLRKIPMGRLGHPEELIGALIFLASDASSFMTGQVVFSDGGRLLG
jgi:NAD(P)-dependent dehydrogenase (short-subunit alcohol dehydrogenase family)